MRGGLIALTVVAEFLGKKPSEMEVLVREDGLPVVSVPARTRPVRKVSLLALHRWLREHSENRPLTVDELAEELDWASELLSRRSQARKDRRETAQEAQVA